MSGSGTAVLGDARRGLARPRILCGDDALNMRISALLLAVGLVVTGCAAASERECEVGADCPTGACSASGTCVPATAPTDAGSDTTDDVADAGDAAPPTDGADATPSDTADAPTGCLPNGDGTIHAAEIPLGPGLKATFRAAENAAFATAGTAKGDGTRAWDLSIAFAGDKDVLVKTRAPAGTWWAGKFPSATYATELSLTSDLLGVFQTTATGLVLLGVVSPTDGVSRTELKYATPPSALQFPLTGTSAWKVTSNVSGTATGLFSTYSETWDSKVDARGELKTPFGKFDVLRVRTVLTRTVGFSVTVTRSFAFVTECFGTVATVASKANETQEEFTTAAELRRLAP